MSQEFWATVTNSTQPSASSSTSAPVSTSSHLPIIVAPGDTLGALGHEHDFNWRDARIIRNGQSYPVGQGGIDPTQIRPGDQVVPAGQPQPTEVEHAEAAADATASNNEVEEICDTCPSCENFTAENLQNVFNRATVAQRKIAADEMNYSINLAKIDSYNRVVHFLGQCKHEGSGNILTTESFNYSVQGLKNTFLHYRNNPELAQEHGRAGTQAAQQELIANTVYSDANRSASYKLGNTSAGDGWKYRGRGIKQITGKFNYENFTNFHKDLWGTEIDFVENPDLIASDAKYSVRAALWFWSSNHVYTRADPGITDTAIRNVTLAINGGVNGLNNRKTQTKNIHANENFSKICFNVNEDTSNEDARNPK